MSRAFQKLRLFAVKPLFITSIFLILALIGISLSFVIEQNIQTIHKNLVFSKFTELHSIASNIQKSLHRVCNEELEVCLKKEPFKQTIANHLLSLLSTPTIPYVYILKLSPKQMYYYLADGSTKERASFLQPFILPQTQHLFQALQTQKPTYELHHDVANLWMTYYYPLDHTTLLVFDISMNQLKHTKQLLTPIKDILYLSTLFLGGVFLFSLFWALLFFNSQKKSRIDPLTKLYNRNILPLIQSNTNLQKDAIVALDLDHFKKVNDTYGHDVGDLVLKQTGSIILHSISPKDFAIRMGGEEFLIILKNITPIQSKRVAHRILRSIANTPISANSQELSITASIGLVPPGSFDQFDRALKKADQLLYDAKVAGRNQVVVYKEHNRHGSLILEEVIEAIQNDGLLFYYQPIVTFDKKIVKYEMLVRLRLDGSIYPPGLFLPLIENTTHYRLLTKKLLEEAFRIIRQRGIHLSINFNIHDFNDETLFEIIEENIQKHHEIASHLTFELLENIPIDEMKKAKKAIDRLRALGIKIALDDVGEGYAGLRFILNLEPDIVKIDRGILLSIDRSDPKKMQILSMLIDSFIKLGTEVVIEGVEDEEQVKMLHKMGDVLMQGYYFAKPSPNLSADDTLKGL